MLRSLTIQNIVLIEREIIDFAAHMTAFTGETGAGKSILLDALGLALGARADVSLVRHGTDQAVVVAELDIQGFAGSPLYALLMDQGIDVTDHILLLKRIINSDGRSRAFVNDQSVSVGFLKEIGAYLIDIHGQYDTHRLFDTARHIQILDEFAGHKDAVQRLNALWQTLKETEFALKTLDADLEKAARDQDYMQSSLDDLEKLQPQLGEEDHLLTLRQRLKNQSQLMGTLNQMQQIIESEGGLHDQSRQLWRHAEKVENLLPDKEEANFPLFPILERLSSEMDALDQAVTDIVRDQKIGDLSLDQIEDRLHDLRTQARKHRCSVDGLTEIWRDFQDKIRLFTHQEGERKRLIAAVSAAKENYINAARAISAQRTEAIKALESSVMQELEALKLGKAQFAVQQGVDENAANATGIDAIQFMVATNSGMSLAPLHKTASGGEVARFMLALKLVLARTQPPSTFIFDEADAGVGGATADAVGLCLSSLAKQHQVFVITHSPQVAARANHHILVEKADNDHGKTITRLTPLTDTARNTEIARMLSGEQITTEALTAAQRLLVG
jgi:DNA repair protein RecN (Recombination protein N)